jgi:hypothetical protein
MKRLSENKVLSACESLLGIAAKELPKTDALQASDYYAGLVYTPATPREPSSASGRDSGSQ